MYLCATVIAIPAVFSDYVGYEKFIHGLNRGAGTYHSGSFACTINEGGHAEIGKDNASTINSPLSSYRTLASCNQKPRLSAPHMDVLSIGHGKLSGFRQYYAGDGPSRAYTSGWESHNLEDTPSLDT